MEEVDDDSRFARMISLYAEAKMEAADLSAEVQALTQRLASAQADLTQIRALMGTVAVYEGLADISPLVSMVGDLVNDQAELERRIDAAVMHCSAHRDTPLAHEVAAILRGANKTPDSPEGL